jgi:hypothetical protein
MSKNIVTLVSAALLSAATTTVASAAPVSSATTATPAENTTAGAAAGTTGLPASFSKKAKKPFYAECKKSQRFAERRFNYTPHAVLAGRCVTSKKRIRGVKLISSYGGHHPSAEKALDLMVNLHGSCSAGNPVGDRVARYLMNNARKHGIRYLIWQNKYWAATSEPMPLRNWRPMGRPGCTAGHFDHVHAAFR